MDENLLEKFSSIMYKLTKDAARSSFIEFLEDLEVDYGEWEEIKFYLKEKYNVKTYI